MCARYPDAFGAAGIAELRTQGNAAWGIVRLPAEQGRDTLFRWSMQQELAERCVPPPWNVRSRVHEYGGGAYAVGDGEVFFVDFNDGAIHWIRDDGEPQALTFEAASRYGDLAWDPAGRRLYAVRELANAMDPHAHPHAQIVAIQVDSGILRVLVEGPDFLSSPRPSRDGSRLAWLSWNHPNMPWDDVQLNRAQVQADGSLADSCHEASTVAQARMQPVWALDATSLYFLSDADGWWNLYVWPDDKASARQVTALRAEIGSPGWMLGQQHWMIRDDASAAILFTTEGYWHAATVDLTSGAVLDCSGRHALLSSLTVAGGDVIVAGADERGSRGLYRYSQGKLELCVRGPTMVDIEPPGEIPVARAVQVKVPPSRLTAPGEICHAWFYPPAHADFEPLPNELPPVIVTCHGGPTAASSASFQLTRLYWTSRGFAVLDVNYRGSSGWGRNYRRRLYGGFGVLDVEDAVAALRHVVDLGWIDGNRATIMGASAGGCITLGALTDYDVFNAGVNLFGVFDLQMFVVHAHKFESHFLDSLVGDWRADGKLLHERSPISRLAGIRAPLMTQQGSDDLVVPPEQSRRLMDAVRSRGLPCCYLEFPDEGHGFRREDSIVRSIEATLSFLAQVYRFEVDAAIEPVVVENLPRHCVRALSSPTRTTQA